ncbi:glycosyltransferase [Pseudalgibacter alginicilyticus]|uniref:Glycosyltransferase n=1 Tax=Pseudalgibacter alginicilyticus TaxID=1736674 RepID=A0A0P0CKU3_9FLAO|nr:glycosyltransferase [Pseudalgibacter alginicilyticus]ALJ06841.1 glycosyltransferase [Pseudalgibacter alginicilyticus]
MKKRILIASLNWGLGHATRCIPIIDALLAHGFEPIIASDGFALSLLQKEFPNLLSIELPAYNITYAKNGAHFKLKLLKDSPKVLKAINSEKETVKEIIETYNIQGIISDNRLGVRSKKVPSIFITHQLNVLSGNTTWLSTKMHQKIIKKFDVCWVPDVKGSTNLSGKLSHTHVFEIPTEYIGPLSRLELKPKTITNNLLVLLSGPEPQRTLLEEKLLLELKNYPKKVVFVKGVLEKEQTIQTMGNLTIYNFMTSSLLEKTINESEFIISRSGYTTIMDLAKLNKKAFFIPTPGQYEQEYLAKRLTELEFAPSCSQETFTISQLEKINNFKGLSSFHFKTDFKRLFSLFESK